MEIINTLVSIHRSTVIIEIHTDNKEINNFPQNVIEEVAPGNKWHWIIPM
jgi:hypothetical protein